MAKETYAQKLKDPRWQKKRLQIFERDKWCCSCCGDDESTLHVHHFVYVGGDPWDTPNEFLGVLCESCHEYEHANYTAVTTELIKAIRSKRFNVWDLRVLAKGFQDMPEFHATEVMASVIKWVLSEPGKMKQLEDDFFTNLSDTSNGKNKNN